MPVLKSLLPCVLCISNCAADDEYIFTEMYLGCWVEPFGTRDFDTMLSDAAYGMWLHQCLRGCKTEGWRYAALEVGQTSREIKGRRGFPCPQPQKIFGDPLPTGFRPVSVCLKYSVPFLQDLALLETG